MKVSEKPVALDVEIFPNYFLIALKNADELDTHVPDYIELKGANEVMSPIQKRLLYRAIMEYQTIGFNSERFDIPLVYLALKGKSVNEIYRFADWIIKCNAYSWQIWQKLGMNDPIKSQEWNHIDIMPSIQGIHMSLKLYAARLHYRSLIDIPIEPGSTVTKEQVFWLREYCVNDVEITIRLWKELKERIQLRADMSNQYNTNLMNRGDAQIAEAVFKEKMGNKKPPSIQPNFHYKAPEWLKFKSKSLINHLYSISENVFRPETVQEFKTPKVMINGKQYTTGIGGLHSNEKNVKIDNRSNSGRRLLSVDVSSYYPAIILALGLFPTHLGLRFTRLYQNITNERLQAKKRGNKTVSESLKIVINGVFGKFNNPYSMFYSPQTFAHITLTGQLALLMLIEWLEERGFDVVSANTDGLVVDIDSSKLSKFRAVCGTWELWTGFVLEETEWQILYAKDVSNYFAYTADGEFKSKGAFSPASMIKNPHMEICYDAIKENIVHGTDLAAHIKSAKSVHKYILVRTVKGGAHFKGEKLGRIVRWYYSKGSTEKIQYISNDNKVPLSDGACPIMRLPKRKPEDIDYDRYLKETEKVMI